MSECIQLVQADPNQVIADLWEALQAADTKLPGLPAEGAGESAGDVLSVRWARSVAESFFACEVIDRAHGEVWEAGVVHPGYEHPVAFWRRILGVESAPPSPWQAAVADRFDLRPFVPRTEPTFFKLCQAYMRDAETHFSDDAASREQLHQEASYWRDLAKGQLKTHRAERAADRLRIEALSAASTGPMQAEVEPERIWRLDEMEEWTAKHCDQIIVLPRAIAAAKKSDYHAPQHVYDALELLANEYQRLKKGEIAHPQFMLRCAEVGVDYTRSVDRSVAGEAGEEYFVRWKGRRRFLNHHLGRGTARDPRFTLRIYFTWDDEDEVVVVGWLPSHLTASMS